MKIVRRLVTWLLAISMILGSLVTDAVTAYAAESYDLTSYIKTEELYKGKYDSKDTSNKISSGFSLNYDDTVTFRITWTLGNDLKNITDADTFSYTIPANLQYSDSNGYLIQNNNQIGEYSIKDNVFTFHYYETYLIDTKNDANRNGYANLTTTITKEDTNDENGADIEWSFPGGATYSGHINEDTSNYKMEINKSATDADSNLTSLKERPFEIVVKAKGKNSDVKVTDTLGQYLTVDGGISKSSFTVTKKDGTEVSDYTLNETSNGFEITFDEMQDKDEYTIAYTASIDKSVLNESNEINQWSNPNNGLTNTAAVTSNYQTSKKESSDTPHIKKQWLSKTGNKNSDGSIDWTIVVNAAGGVETDLEGAVIKDTLGTSPKHDYVEDSFSVTPSDDAVSGLDFDTLQEGFEFKASTTATYTIKYTTKPDTSSSQYQTYSNDVSLTPNGSSKAVSASGSVGVGSSISVSKACLTDVVSDNNGQGASDRINWTSTVTIPAGYGNISGRQFTDSFDNKMTLDTDSVQLNGESIASDENFSATSNGFSYTLDIENGDEEQTFTFTYTTIVDVDKVTSGTWLNNTASYNNISASKGYTYKEEEKPVTLPTAAKTVSGTKDGNYGNSLENSTGTAWWQVRIDNPSVLAGVADGTSLVVKDTVPEGLEYTGNAYLRYHDSSWQWYEVDLTNTGTGNELEFDVSDYLAYFQAGDQWNGPAVRYETRFVLSESGSSNEMTNTAAWYLDGEDGKSASATYTFEAKSLLSKDKVYTTGTAPFVNYTINVNSKAATINNGQDYSIDDTSGSAISIDWSTIKVVAGDGSDWTGKVVDEKTITGLHDATSYTITYQAKVTKKYTAGATFSGDEAKNTVSFSGKTSDSWSKNESLGKSVLESSAGADETVNNLEIYKYDSENTAKGLDGAVFTLYKVDSTRDSATGKVTLGDVDESSGVSRTTATTRAGSITKVGRATFNSLTSNQVYLLKETKAPSGYKIDPVYEKGIYLVYTGTDAQTWDYETTGVNKIINNLETATYSLSVSNTESSEPEEKKFEVEISKVDATSKNELAGAELKITKNTKDGNLATDLTDNSEAKWTSGKETHKVKLAPGTYVLTETQAPTGYDDAESITFVVTHDGKVEVDDKEMTGNKVTMEDSRSETPEPEDDKYKVIISKKAITGDDELAGASLKITTDADGKNVVQDANGEDLSWTSGETAKEVELAEGTYYLHETSAPAGYEIATAIKFTVTKTNDKYSVTRDDGETVSNNTIVMKDTLKSYDVVISKEDINGEEIAGATLQVKDANGEVVAQWQSEEGKTHTVKVTAGTYTLHEEGKPEGYVVASDIKFVVDNDGKVTVAGEDFDKVTMVDKFEDQTVEISKQDIAGDEIEGAKLEITKLGETGAIESWTSEAGKTHKVTLQPGEYTLTETTPPNGYLKATAINFEVLVNGKVEVNGEEFDKVTMTDADDNGEKEVVVSKQDIAGEEIAGATLRVEDEKGNIVVKPFETTGNKDSKNTFHVEPGTYVLIEETAPEGYVRAESIKFTVDKLGKVTSEALNEDGVIVMTDDWSGQEVTISKSDIAGDEVVGASLKVEGKDQAGKAFSESWTTEAGKTHKIKVNPGTYTLTETLAPNGYEKAESIEFTVTVDGKVTIEGNDKAEETAEVVMTDEFSDVDVEISKSDINGEEIDGATLTVTGKTKDGKDIEPIEFTTNGKDTHTFKVQPGTYVLTETTAPDGYERAESIEFVVNVGGKIKIGDSEVKKVVMTDAYARRDVIISKRDIAGSGEVAGAYLAVTDNNGKVVDKWTSEKDGGHKISYAWDPDVNYTLTEITAPDGYDQLKTSITFKVDLDGLTQIQSNHEIDGKAAATVTDDGILVVNNKAVAAPDNSGEDGSDDNGGTDSSSSSDNSGSSSKKSSKKSSGSKETTVTPIESTVEPTENVTVDPSNADSGRGGENVVVLVLTDEETGEPLPQGTFDLYDADKNVIGRYVTNEAGVLRVYGLQPGEYYFVQITAPDGYEIANWDKVFRLTVSDTGEAPMVVAVANRRLNRLPVGDEVGGATGDSSNMVLYGVVAASAAAMLALWFALNRKNHVM